jgi:hypothetical protein
MTGISESLRESLAAPESAWIAFDESSFDFDLFSCDISQFWNYKEEE